MLFPTLVGAVSAIMAWENRGHRTCLLDGEQMEYKCVINEHSVETGKFHNVYIRLKAQKHGKLPLFYRPARRRAVRQCAPPFVVITYLFPILIVSSIESIMWLVILVPITCRVLSDVRSR